LLLLIAPIHSLFPYTTLFRSKTVLVDSNPGTAASRTDRVSTRSHSRVESGQRPTSRKPHSSPREDNGAISNGTVCSFMTHLLDRSEEHTSELQSLFHIV